MSYSVEIDSLDEQEWHRALGEFDDANVFQTWAYGSSRWGARNLSHAVVKHDGLTVGLTQVMLIRAPLCGPILGYAIFGPVWQRSGEAGDLDRYQGIVRALEEAYVTQRGITLRLRPWSADPLGPAIREAMTARDSWREVEPRYETYVLDLGAPIPELHRRLDRKWRANLRKAEAEELRIVERQGRAAIDVFAELSRQTQQRKLFSSRFTQMFEDFYPGLPQTFKPRVFVCEASERPVAAAIISAIGDRAFYLNGASSASGLALRAGYRLQWHVVSVLKEMGSVRWYDLYGGLETPGVKRFKRGLVGAKASEILMPEFQATARSLRAGLLTCALGLYDAHSQIKGRLADLSRGVRTGQPRRATSAQS